MLDWSLKVFRLCRKMRSLSLQALEALDEDNKTAVDIVQENMKNYLTELNGYLPEDFPSSRIHDLKRHIRFSEKGDYNDIIQHDITDIEEKVELYALKGGPADYPTGFDELLHPLVREASIRHYHDKDFRHAVLDAITAVFDKIRERTSIDLDGDKLINKVFSVREPVLVLSEVETQSGQSDQNGFADIFRGFYRGVRNPKAHSLMHDLDARKAAQHLILASILMRRVIEARKVGGDNA